MCMLGDGDESCRHRVFGAHFTCIARAYPHAPTVSLANTTTGEFSPRWPQTMPGGVEIDVECGLRIQIGGEHGMLQSILGLTDQNTDRCNSTTNSTTHVTN
jgi:hypothetical protein